MFGLEDRHIEFILQVLKENFPDAKFYIFGSRAKGTYKEYSDIDIAVDFNGEKLNTDVLGRTLIQFEDSTLPYEVDVIDLNAIEEKFKNIIQESLIELK